MLLDQAIQTGSTSVRREQACPAGSCAKLLGNRRTYQSRSGAALVEFAIVGALTFMLIVGLIVGGLGVYRYNLVATMAREASRQASVHGTQYAKDTGNKAWTASDVYNNVIAPLAVALDTSKLSYQVTWNTSNSPYRTLILNSQIVAVNNTVTVTVTYQWVSEAYFGTVNLTSTSVTPMTY